MGDELWRQKVAAKASSNPCPLWGMDFPLQSVLNQHLAENHDDPAAMKLQCTHCKKWLGNKTFLTNHMRTHSGERPFKCDFCPKMFSTNKSMGFHRKEMHHEEWEANKDQILARKKALTQARRHQRKGGKENGEVAILDETTGIIFN